MCVKRMIRATGHDGEEMGQRAESPAAAISKMASAHDAGLDALPSGYTSQRCVASLNREVDAIARKAVKVSCSVAGQDAFNMVCYHEGAQSFRPTASGRAPPSRPKKVYLAQEALQTSGCALSGDTRSRARQVDGAERQTCGARGGWHDRPGGEAHRRGRRGRDADAREGRRPAEVVHRPCELADEVLLRSIGVRYMVFAT